MMSPIVSKTFLILMVGVIFLVTVICVPPLLAKKCPECGKRNGLDSIACNACGKDFPRDSD